MKASVYIETFGCQMNVADSERAATRLSEAGYSLTHSAAEADVILFNTCSVRAKAAHRVFTRMDNVRRERRVDREPLIGLMGCVAQLEGAALFDHAPALGLVAGTRATDRLPELIDRALRGEERTLDIGERREGDAWNVSPVERHSPYVAFVPIIEGCNKFCSYCIVPFSRGRERSRPAIEIVAEVRMLRAVAATGIERVKFTTSFPRDFHADIVAAIDEHENLCDWVHLPVQSGNDRVLRAMRRGYKVSDYLRRVEAIRASRRRLALTSDVIVGFPGETSEEFEEFLFQGYHRIPFRIAE